MIDKKLTRYDKSRLADLGKKINESRKDYLNICESLFLAEMNKPNSKRDYVAYEKWLRCKVDLERKMRAILSRYMKVYAQYVGLCETIESEIQKGLY